MPRGLGLILFGGLGYVLLYAAVANSGRFATQPWAGLREDAYTGNRSTATGPDEAPPPASSSSSSGPSATVVRHRRRRSSSSQVTV